MLNSRIVLNSLYMFYDFHTHKLQPPPPKNSFLFFVFLYFNNDICKGENTEHQSYRVWYTVSLINTYGNCTFTYVSMVWCQWGIKDSAIQGQKCLLTSDNDTFSPTSLPLYFNKLLSFSDKLNVSWFSHQSKVSIKKNHKRTIYISTCYYLIIFLFRILYKRIRK